MDKHLDTVIGETGKPAECIENANKKFMDMRPKMAKRRRKCPGGM